MPAAVVLLSGGLDSVTTLAVARNRGLRAFALSFRYGQRHSIELECASRQAEALGAERHEVVDLSHFGRLVAPATALVADSGIEVPRHGDDDGIPLTYVPARNALFLSYGLAWAEAVGAREIFIGVNALDYSGYPDCRPEFIAAYEAMANLATKVGVSQEQGISIRAPLQDLHKSEIVELGLSLGVDFSDTVSCYDPMVSKQGQALACGRCDSCHLRRDGFSGAGAPDPTRYADVP